MEIDYLQSARDNKMETLPRVVVVFRSHTGDFFRSSGPGCCLLLVVCAITRVVGVRGAGGKEKSAAQGNGDK